MDKFTSMSIFVDVVEQGGFTPAAAKQGLSRAAASKHIMQLEKSLDAKLLNRTTRRVELTGEGRSYYHHCKQVLTQMDEVERMIKGEDAEPEGVLSINLPLTLGSNKLTALVCEYARTYTGVDIDLSFSNRPVDIEEEGYDVIIRVGAEPSGSGAWKLLAPLQYMICASPVYLTHHGEPSAPEDLARNDCLNAALRPQKTTWQLLDRDGKESQIEVSGTFASENEEALREAAVNHLGIAMLPTYLVDEDLRRMRLKQVLPRYSVAKSGIYAIYPQRQILSNKVQTFVNMLASKLGQNREWTRRLYGVVS